MFLILSETSEKANQEWEAGKALSRVKIRQFHYNWQGWV